MNCSPFDSAGAGTDSAAEAATPSSVPARGGTGSRGARLSRCPPPRGRRPALQKGSVQPRRSPLRAARRRRRSGARRRRRRPGARRRRGATLPFATASACGGRASPPASRRGGKACPESSRRLAYGFLPHSRGVRAGRRSGRAQAPKISYGSEFPFPAVKPREPRKHPQADISGPAS